MSQYDDPPLSPDSTFPPGSHAALAEAEARALSAVVDFGNLPKIRPRGSLSAEWWLARRHLGSKKGEAAVSVVTWLAILCVILAVAAFNIVLSVMTGFEVEMRDKILGANAHVVVTSDLGIVRDYEELAKSVQAVDGVEAVAPFVLTEMMIRSASGASGVLVKGFDPERTPQVTHIREDLKRTTDGDLPTIEAKEAALRRFDQPFSVISLDPDKTVDEYPGILLGEDLASVLRVEPGDRVEVIDPMSGGPSVMGIRTPRVKTFVVGGVFDSGMYEYDVKWTYVTNAAAQELVRAGDVVTGLELKVDDVDEADTIAHSIDAILPDELLHTRHWMEMNQDLYEALNTEKLVMGLLLFLYVLLASALIVSTLIMLVITKHREIAILKAMGASRMTILRMFMMEGSTIGLFGTLAGTAIGLAGCWFLDWYGYPLSTNVYFLDTLPVIVTVENVVVVAGAAFLSCVLATLYPAMRAASLDPVEGLRYE